MNCTSARDCFSEAIDGRLPETERAALDAHVVECSACSQRWRMYRRVCAAAPGLARSTGVSAAFQYPPEAPGEVPLISLRDHPASRGRRPWVAAAAVVLLGMSHWMLWELATGTSGMGAPTPTPGDHGVVAQAGSSHAEPSEAPLRNQPVSSLLVSEEQAARRFLRDHADASDLLRRQLLFMPKAACDSGQADQIARHALALLGSREVRNSLKDVPLALRGIQGENVARRYVQIWEAIGNRGDVQGPSRISFEWLRREMQTAELGPVAVGARALVAAEPVGEAIREEHAFRSPYFGTDDWDLSQDVKFYLSAHRDLLEGRYLAAATNFDHLTRVAPSSPLVPLANFLHAEAWRRAGVHSNAMRVLVTRCTELDGMFCGTPCEETACDPLVGPVVQMVGMGPAALAPSANGLPIGSHDRARFICALNCGDEVMPRVPTSQVRLQVTIRAVPVIQQPR